jgi:2',3'-cyclic-nucleotide 2'-phosphodiesterase/3'-nucleotidase
MVHTIFTFHSVKTIGMIIKKVITVSEIIFFVLFLISCSRGRVKKIAILETTDVHGAILPYDFIENERSDVSLAGVASYLRKIRKEKEITFLLDDGDNLQGQPEVYYYNFIDTVSPHFNAEVMNYLGYDAGELGNHDIEAGHGVYDRIRREYKFPLLAANAVDLKTGKPYFKPYSIIQKGGVKLAVFGLVTPAIPTWLPPELYSGMEFRDMLETARIWMPVIKKERPDIIIGLFHSGWERNYKEEKTGTAFSENGSASVAYNVPGFDIIFNGHDHQTLNEKIVNSSGDTVLIIDGGSRSVNIGEADISISSKKVNGKKLRLVSGKIINVKDYQPDAEFINRFSSQDKVIKEFVSKVIGKSTATISSRDSYFGSSAFVDMIHSIQLEITGADVSFAAPLSFDVKISKGPVTVGDMFKLYRFENMLYTIRMTGEEIMKYLEYSYSGWFNTMKGPGDILLKLRTGNDGKPALTSGKAWLKNQPYNFDSAAGIDYIVDVSKPEGHRITIKSFSDGKPFETGKTYKIAVNSYRGNGGGGIFTEGAGISIKELRNRLISSTDRDLRYYIMKSIESKKIIKPAPLNNWHLIPEKWVKIASAREYPMLFGSAK